MKKISASLKENTLELKKILHVDKNFDLIYREQKLGQKDAGFFFIDGFIKDTIMERLLKSFSDIQDGDVPESAREFSMMLRISQPLFYPVLPAILLTAIRNAWLLTAEHTR